MKSLSLLAPFLGASLVAATPSDPLTTQLIRQQKRQAGGIAGAIGGLFGGGKVKDPAGAAPRKVELPVRVQIPGAKTLKVRYGPYKVANMKVKNFLGEEGALWNYPDPVVDKPCDQCTIVGMNAGLEYADGKNANVDTGVWLHHMVLFSVGPGRQDATCGKSPIALPHMIVGSSGRGSERLFSSGNERTHVILPQLNATKVGYKVKTTDRFGFIVDLMNETEQDKVVYLTMTYDFVPGHPADYDDMKPVWFDVAQCLTSEWPAPYNTGRYTIPSSFWTADFDGEILGAAGHLHDGGDRVLLEVDGKVVCNSEASYGTKPEFISKTAHGGGTTEHLSKMSICTGDTFLEKRVTKGQKWQLRAQYDYSRNAGNHHGDGKQANVMGIAIMFVRVKSK